MLIGLQLISFLKRQRLAIILIGTSLVIGGILFLVIPGSKVNAHQSGCHSWHSCPSDSGSYVCGDLGYTSQCGTTNYVAPKAVVPKAAPIVTTTEEFHDTPISFTSSTKENSEKPEGESSTIQEGKVGTKRDYEVVTKTNGVETSRAFEKTAVITAPVEKITEVGTKKPDYTLIYVLMVGGTFGLGLYILIHYLNRYEQDNKKSKSKK